ncbi:MAG: hypothetical protein AVDCRST_MAG35-1629, partial [uncultured Quadrisphaera sp.]
WPAHRSSRTPARTPSASSAPWSAWPPPGRPPGSRSPASPGAGWTSAAPARPTWRPCPT